MGTSKDKGGKGASRIGNWPEYTMGYGAPKKTKKKAPKKKTKGAGLLLGRNSPFEDIPLLNLIL